MRLLFTAVAVSTARAAFGATLDDQSIRKAAEDILSNDMYQYESRARINVRWDWLLDPMERVWDAVTDYLDRLFASAPEGTQTALYVVLATVVLLILAHVIYTVWRAVQPPPRISLPADGETAVVAGPGTLVARADALAAAGNYVDASRALYEASLLMLEDKRKGHLRRGLTATEYLRTFQAPWVRDNLRTFVDLINWKWYRARSFDADDYAQCRTAYQTLVTKLQEMGS